MYFIVIRTPCKTKSSRVIDKPIEEDQNDEGHFNNESQIPIIAQDMVEVQLENRPKSSETDSITQYENDPHHSISSENKASFEDNAAKNGLNFEINLNQVHNVEENKEDEIKSISDNQD